MFTPYEFLASHNVAVVICQRRLTDRFDSIRSLVGLRCPYSLGLELVRSIRHPNRDIFVWSELMCFVLAVAFSYPWCTLSPIAIRSSLYVQ